MDRDVVLNKLESLRRCLQRVGEKTPPTFEEFAADVDVQDIVVLNLERAVQCCVDVGLHILSGLEGPVPETMAMTFDGLKRVGVLDDATAERMVKAVGFRNTVVHAYQEMDLSIVYRIMTHHLDDFRSFARQILVAAGLRVTG